MGQNSQLSGGMFLIFSLCGPLRGARRIHYNWGGICSWRAFEWSITVRIGTRLTLVLLPCMMPVLAAYTYWNVERSNIYVNELKQSARAVSSGVAPSVDEEVVAQEWDKINDAFRKMNAEGTRSAMLRKDGTLLYSLPDFPANWSVRPGCNSHIFRPPNSSRRKGIRNWFCELVPLKGQGGEVIGYLLEVQDWTKAERDSRAQCVAAIVVALVLLGLVATVIPLRVNRYVSRPLADLSAKVVKFSSDESKGSAVAKWNYSAKNSASSINNSTRRAPISSERHRRELELERELQRADRLATIGALAAGLAHEIGTPMGVIRVRAEALQHDETMSADSRGKLGIIVRQIDRITRIVRMLLDYARKSESHKAICDLRIDRRARADAAGARGRASRCQNRRATRRSSTDGKLRRRSDRTGVRQSRS